MDQVRVILGWIKQHHFWLLSVVVLGVCVASWYTAAGALSTEFKANQNKINSEFQSLSSLRNKPFKPSDSVNARQAQEIVNLSSEVRTLWSSLYESQKEQVLNWPSTLGDSFINSVQGLEFGDRMREDMRERYLNYIQKRFPQLVEIIDARLMAADGGVGRRGGRPLSPGGVSRFGEGRDEEEVEEEFIVEWLDQELLRGKLELNSSPSSLRIWVTQEDLWVYESLLTAIANTNKAAGATRQSNAAVRIIQELQVGADAAGQNDSSGRLYSPDSNASAAGAFGGGDSFPMSRDSGIGSFTPGASRDFGGPAGGGNAEGDEAATLLSGRYLDDEGEPITSISAGNYDFGSEYKRLPVRMSLEMDQTWLSKLIVELANAPLQVEVEQVRINPGGGKRRIGDNEIGAFDRQPNVGTVILQGAVYIFNKPSDEKLEVEGVDGAGV
ncbi:hypothetical protein Mal64_10790 [Pseudobythopirellula maris]|uniref:Uncharacterized protein n=1 Tax=Pseudobythopirellula maris TaxID=2527991 RepID=A0A5C5ZT15_9BACT|nr:hypothetical protein [Pseudobythopirellula maris]TWT90684.1 hypothetical protein Mal64_10790 [Pseudobythopirellula maris]